MLDVKNLSVTLGGARILEDVSFTVREGQWLMILGPNGAGKSTIVNAISGGVPYTGEVRAGRRKRAPHGSRACAPASWACFRRTTM